jgi:hypothetical protein
MQAQIDYYKYDSQVAEMLQEGLTHAQIVAKILKTTAKRDDDTIVRGFRRFIARHQKRLLDEHEGLYEATNNLDVPNTATKNMWIKNKEASLFVVNPNYREAGEVRVEDIDFKKLFGKIKPFEYKKKTSVNNGLFDRLVYTDTHVAMKIEDYSLYGGIWDEHELDKMCNKMIEHTIENRNAKVLYIDDLGDFLDGYNAQTTRGGHTLPQNMSNEKAFEVGLMFKIKLINSLVPYYDSIICHNVCNDNHSGSWGHNLNLSFKVAIEAMIPNKVKVTNFKRFIDHYIAFDYPFVLNHGKDKSDRKFGLKPKLEPKTITTIDNYLNRYGLKGTIEFSKGDSHIFLFDGSSAERFNYYNYPALSPSSAWVQHNFQQGISGFVSFNYLKGGKDKRILPCITNHSLTTKTQDNDR